MIIPRGNGVISNRQTTDGRLESAGTQANVSLVSTAMSFASKWKQEKDETQTQEAINSALKKKNEWKASNLTREGKAAEGLTEDYLSFNKEIEEEIGSNLSNNAREKFNNWQIRDTEQDKLGVMMHQRKQDEFVKKAAFSDGLAISEESIRLDAKGNWKKAFDHAALTLDQGLKSGVIAPEEFEAKKTEMTNKFRGETSKSYYTQDKHDFMRTGIHELGLGETEKAYYQEKYNNDLRAEQREKKLLYSEEYKQIMSKVDDMGAQASANKDTSYFHENAQKLEAMGYSAAAVELKEKALVFDDVIKVGEETKGMTFAEKKEYVSSIKLPAELDASSSKYKAMVQVQKELIKEEKLLKEDPAEYVKTRAVGTTAEEIAGSRLSLQKANGVMPNKGFQVLTKTEKETFKATWETGTVQDRTALLKEASKYGKHSGKVIKEVGMNSLLSIAPMIAKSDKDLEFLVAGASGDKNPILMDMDPATKKDYTDKAKESRVLQVLSRTQSMFPVNEGLSKNYQDMENAIVGMSALKVDPGFGSDFLDSKLKVLDDGDKSIFFSGDMDEDEMEDLLDNRKQELVQKFGTRSRIRDAVWVNTPSGYMLGDPHSGLPVPGSEFSTDKIDDLNLATKEAKKKKQSIGDDAARLSLR